MECLTVAVVLCRVMVRVRARVRIWIRVFDPLAASTGRLINVMVCDRVRVRARVRVGCSSQLDLILHLVTLGSFRVRSSSCHR